MDKQEFLTQLQNKLYGLPDQDVNRSIEFYSEMIDDRIEEGLSEQAAVAEIGCVDEITSQIIADIPITKLLKAKIKTKKRLNVWEIVLLVLGSPIWLSLLIAALVIIISLYASLWSILISLWAVFASLIGCAIGGFASGICFSSFGNWVAGIAMIGAGICCVGLSIFMFFGCKAATKGFFILTKKIILGIKNCFLKKEEA